MQFNLSKSIRKIYTAFINLGKLPKYIIKYGSLVFLILFAAGTFLFVYNRAVLNYEPYFEFIATSIIKTSFTILAEAVVGGLLIDYIIGK